MSAFKASEKKRYSVCYPQKTNPDLYFIHAETYDIETAEEERKIMLEDEKFKKVDIRIREEITKVNWYSYS